MMRSTSLLGVILLVVTSGGLIGCSGPRAGSLPTSASDALERSAGLTLLRDVLARNARVDGILMFKTVDPPVKTLIGDIASSCSRLRDRLDDWARVEDAVDLEATGLPAVEARARALREEWMTRTLLGSSGMEFQLNLLVSQVQALGYASALAEAAAEREPKAARAEDLRHMARTLQDLASRVEASLAAQCGESG